MTEETSTQTGGSGDGLYEATESIRAAEFAEVPTELLEEVLRAEERNLEDRVVAAREVAQRVDSWLASHRPPEPEEEKQ